MIRLRYTLIVLSLLLMSGVRILEEEKVDNVFKRDKELVQVKSVAQEQADIILDMRDEVRELHETTCKLTQMLKSTGDKNVRRDCKHRDYRDSDQPTTRGGDTHRGGNGFNLTTTTER
jgi:hypothetical protein